MPREVEKLTALAVSRKKVAGYYGDGAGLYLQVAPGGSKSWVFKFKIYGRAREMGLGGVDTFTLAEARQRAGDARKLLKDKIDPIEHRNAARQAALGAVLPTITFDKAAEKYINSHRAGWKNEKHGLQWEATLRDYASPIIGKMSCRDIDTDHVLRVIEPIWSTKTETANRVRNRIELVLDWATTSRYREGLNPARWKGHIETKLPKRSKVAKVKHHPAVPLNELPAVFKAIGDMGGMGAKALLFAILTAARSGEVRGALWSEIDLKERVWNLPASRMKGEREHRVPLSQAAIELLLSLPRRDDPTDKTPELVFPAPRGGQLSDMTLSAVMRRLGRGEVPHGFRSAFRDWAGDRTSYPHDLCEMALAHTISNKAEAAYRRGEMLERRRPMMEDWASFCVTPSHADNVVPMKAKAA